MKRKTWLTKLLLSYLPVFLVTTCVIIMILLFVITQASKDDVLAANRILANQVMYSVDNFLSTIDRSVVRELYLNRDIAASLSGGVKQDESPHYANYQIFKILQEYLINNSDAMGVYLYRFSDQQVLSNYGVSPLSDFHDHDFIDSLEGASGFPRYSGSRFVANPYSGRGERVVSLSRTWAGEGAIVVNMPVESLRRLIKDTQIPDSTFIDILDSDGNLILSTHDDEGEPEQSDTLHELNSKYGWIIRSGLNKGAAFYSIRFTSLIWIVVCIILTIAGALLIIHLSKRNYRPLADLLSDIEDRPTLTPLLNERQSNEFSLISKALDTFEGISQTHRRDKYFRDILLGRHIDLSDDEFVELDSIDDEAQTYTVIVMQIDNQRNQPPESPAKFDKLFANIVEAWRRLLNDRIGIIWHGLMEPCRFAMVLDKSDSIIINDVATVVCDWVKSRATLSVSIGIGDPQTNLSALASSYQEANIALDFKCSREKGAVIAYKQSYRDKYVVGEKGLEAIHQIAISFRAVNAGWRGQMSQWYEQLSRQELSISDVDYQYRVLFDLLRAEIHKLSDAYASIWNETTEARLLEALDSFEFLSDIQDKFTLNLMTLFDSFIILKNERQANKIAILVRDIVNGNYQDPDFSLVKLADILDLNPNYLSTLIRDETGVTFTRLLNETRISRAKELLVDTDDFVSVIGANVGYLNAITFHRVFKQLTNYTPGDYRKKFASNGANPM